ncbi:RDD family protein [Nonomuraea sp. NPDC050556]|uniref:RDD family protein n=1 Tax=Nonomuraea sp. NPDC050556 TaxID=3364369 RepID=UPI0037B87138
MTVPPQEQLPAEWWERLVARLIESLVFGVFYYILFIALWAVFRTVGMDDVLGARLSGLLGWLVAGFGYTVYDCVAISRHGRTFGKAIMKIRVVGEPGSGVALKRSLVYPAPTMLMGIPVVNLLGGIFVFAVGLFILIDRPMLRGPHDRFAGTRVVKDAR